MQKTEMQNGSIHSEFWWLIPRLIGFSRNVVPDKLRTYGLHLTMYFTVTFNIPQLQEPEREYIDPLDRCNFNPDE